MNLEDKGEKNKPPVEQKLLERVTVFGGESGGPTLCMVRSQFPSVKASYLMVNSGTCQAFTIGGAGYKGNSLILRVLSSSEHTQSATKPTAASRASRHRGT